MLLEVTGWLRLAGEVTGKRNEGSSGRLYPSIPSSGCWLHCVTYEKLSYCMLMIWGLF